MTATHLSDLNTAAVMHKLRLGSSSSVPPSPAIVQSATQSPSQTQPLSFSPTSPSNPSLQPKQSLSSPLIDPDSPPPPPEKPPGHRPSVTSLGLRSPTQSNSPPLSPPLTGHLPQSPTQPLSISALRLQQAQNGHPPRQAYGSYVVPASQAAAVKAVAERISLPPSDKSSTAETSSPALAQNSPPPPALAALPGLGVVTGGPGRRSMHPEDEWREQQESRPTSAYAALAPEDDQPRPAEEASSSGLVLPASGDTSHSMEAEQDQAALAVELALTEEAAKLEREQAEQNARQAEAQASEKARAVAEQEARRRWEGEQAERDRLDAEDRARLEVEEKERREAGERLRREEQRRAEAVAHAEAETARLEEQARMAAEAEQSRVRAAEEVRLHEEAELAATAQKAAAQRAGRDELVGRVRSAASADEVILSGHVTAQASDSIYWRRRFFQLRPGSLSLYKAEGEGKALGVVELPGRVARVVDKPEEASGVLNSFKLALKDGEDWLFFTDGAEDKELLVVAIKAAAGI